MPMMPNAVPQMNEITAITRCTVKNAVMPPVGPHDLGSSEMFTMNVGQITHDQIPKTTMNHPIGRETLIAPVGLVATVSALDAVCSICGSGVTGRVTDSVSVLAGVRSQSGLN
jgi:hypothetical protein